MSTSRKKRSCDQNNRLRKNILDVVEGDSCELFERDDYIDAAIIPDADDSDIDSDSGSGDEDYENDEISANAENILSYKQIVERYSTDQKYLQEQHKYDWINGEKHYSELPDNKYLLKDSDKCKLQNSSPSQLFEMFFTSEMKNYIIEATSENGISLSMNKLDSFLGILILTAFNTRTNIRDYWSTNPLLECPVVKSTMSRNDFTSIKSNIKCSKKSEENKSDPIWRVRTIWNMFKKYIKQFGYFETALSVDEMMVKFNGRLGIKQFIRNKPVRFGIKVWGLCGSDGYLFDCNIYCGKKESNSGKLAKCALGSRVVLNLLDDLLNKTIKKN